MENAKKRVLVIEDEEPIARIIKDYLTVNQYEVEIAGDGRSGLDAIERLRPDFIVLDIMLPGDDGISLCRQIRERHSTPILILSARSGDTDKVLGLGFGADDYMTKPFSLSELLARIQAHLRRIDGMSVNLPQSDLLRFGPLSIDKKGYKATVDGRDVSLTAKEFELLAYLAEHPNQVFTKSQLLDAIWGFDAYGDENTITVYIRRLREKVENNPSSPAFIRTVWGVGYKFSQDEFGRG
ncbi:response regulator transcription factor [Paenibacillus sp. NEAU-GSW1]|uniref:response regulator transcription factor n=1 Tax=Paenibacillus sp. NEAU-GSW1 TaxID=2682486 RepID=UPI0012E227E5|nr:response regulator transcription factor [Paenibacillus sp. NEAU-GSW1]MUT65742.1 response regulator [Paenibacillus sp. NEAU-GSW1]